MLFKLPVSMLGQKMDLFLSRHARERVLQRSAWEDPETVLFRVAELLQREDIADHLLNEVRIGDCAVILDLDANCSYGLDILADSVTITTVYYRCEEGKAVFAGRKEFFIMLQHAQIQFADYYERMVKSYYPAMA